MFKAFFFFNFIYCDGPIWIKWCPSQKKNILNFGGSQLLDIVNNLGGKLYIIVGDLEYILLVGNLVPSTQSSSSRPFKFSLFFFLIHLYIFQIRGVFMNKILQSFDDFARYLFLGLAHNNKIKEKDNLWQLSPTIWAEIISETNKRGGGH
jgi:hypothetical protein